MLTIPNGFETWLQDCSRFDRDDPLWRMSCYRLARFVGDSLWDDVDLIRRRPLGHSIADQLIRAGFSISSNLAEGYSRSSGFDRARMFEYALGSTRESLVWYDASRRILPKDRLDTRMDTLIGIRRQLLTIIPEERRRRIGQR